MPGNNHDGGYNDYDGSTMLVQMIILMTGPQIFMMIIMTMMMMLKQILKRCPPACFQKVRRQQVCTNGPGNDYTDYNNYHHNDYFETIPCTNAPANIDSYDSNDGDHDVVSTMINIFVKFNGPGI